MPIDASIYQNIQPITPVSPMDNMSKALTLSNLGLQNQNAKMANQQAQYQMQAQEALKNAYANNMNPDGSVNQSGVLSQLGRDGFGQKAIELGQQLNQYSKARAEAQAAQMQSLHQQATIAVPNYKYLLSLDDDAAKDAYPKMIHTMAQQGLDISNLPPSWNRNAIGQAYNAASQYKEQADNALTVANTRKSDAETGKIQDESGQVTNKLAQEFKDDLDPNKARGGNLAKSQGMVNASDRLNGIFKQFPDYNIPKAQQTELVSAFGTLLNGGSAPMQSQIEELVPKSARGDANAMAAWVLNQPLGQGQQQFMKMLHESVGREREIAQAQVRDAQMQRLPSHALLAQRAPDLYNSVLKGYGIDPNASKGGKSQSSDDENDDESSPPKRLASGGKNSDLFQSANAGQASPNISAHDAQALQWMKTADKTSPEYFGVRNKLVKKGLIK